MDEKIKQRKEGFELMLKESLKKLSEKKEVSSIFKDYFLIESTYTSIIKESQLNNQISKYLLYTYLNEYYYLSQNEEIILSRKFYEKKIKTIFYSFVLSPSFAPVIDKLFGDEGESTFDTNKNSIMKGIHESFYDLIIKTIRNSISLTTVPNFILYYDKKIINSKINDIIIYKYSFNYSDKERKSIEYKYLENLYNNFNKEQKPLFDNNLFNLEFRMNLFKLMILSNYKFIKKNEIYSKKFVDKFERYILIFKLKEKSKELLDEYNNIMAKIKMEEIESQLKDIISGIKNDLFKVDKNKDNKNNNVIIVHDDNNQELKSLNKKYLKLIFGFSMMFNNIISVVKKNIKEGVEEISYRINNKIRCSSIERQFLLNILSLFKDEKSYIYNYLLETYIYEDATKKNNRHLYQKMRDDERVTIPYNSILNGMSGKSNEKKDDKEKEEENKNKNKINENKSKSSINEEQQKFVNEFLNFWDKNKLIFEQKEIKKGFFGSIFNSKAPIYIDTPEGKIVNFSIYNLKLIPIINRKISSSQVSIIIDGSTYDSIVFESDEKRLSHKEIFNTFFSNCQYLNSDFYCYDWQSLNYKNKIDFKDVSIFYGRLLAYIIISKLFFQFQTINLIGQSTGCKIIKNCLLELHQLKNKLNIYDIINNVILIGGATHFNMDKYPYLFDNVTGKIVNIFSKNDKELFEYKKNAVGLNELKVKKEFEDKYNIMNIDLSKKYIKQEEYIFELPRIFINDLNIN